MGKILKRIATVCALFSRIWCLQYHSADGYQDLFNRRMIRQEAARLNLQDAKARSIPWLRPLENSHSFANINKEFEVLPITSTAYQFGIEQLEAHVHAENEIVLLGGAIWAWTSTFHFHIHIHCG